MKNQYWTPKLLLSSNSVAPSWLDFPTVVLACSPHDPKKTCRYSVDPSFAILSAQQGRRNPAFELWSQVHGIPPRVPNVDRQALGEASAGLISLGNAHACFKGVRRPFGSDDFGSSVLSYVTKPTFSYEYVVDLVTVARKFEFPTDLVFIINVKLVNTWNDHSVIPEGIVTHWGSVEADVQHNLLPRDYAERFEERLW